MQKKPLYLRRIGPSSNGFSLLEILIAVGLLSLVTLGVMQMFDVMNRSQVKYNVDSDAALATNEIVAILSDPGNCLASLGGHPASNTPIGSITRVLQSSNPRYQVGTPLGNSHIQILSYALSDSDPDAGMAGNVTKLLITYQNKQVVSPNNILKKIKLHADVDGAGIITGCRSLSAFSADIWTRGSGTDIYYTGGNVGVGTATPQTSLDVNGAIRPGSELAVVTCSSTTEGSLRYNYSLHAMQFCGGSPLGWKNFGDQANLFPNGYTKMPSGLILQWGFTTNFGNSKTQCFTIPFPNTVFYINVESSGRDVPGANGHNHVGSHTNSCFTYTSETGHNTAPVGTFWFAMGF